MRRLLQVVALFALLFSSALSPALTMPCCSAAMAAPHIAQHEAMPEMHCSMSADEMAGTTDCLTAVCSMHTDDATVTVDRSAPVPDDALAMVLPASAHIEAVIAQPTAVAGTPPDIPRPPVTTLRI